MLIVTVIAIKKCLLFNGETHADRNDNELFLSGERKLIQQAYRLDIICKQPVIISIHSFSILNLITLFALTK